MADTVRKATYRYIEVSDKPGEGARILSALKEAGVNLLAYSGFPVSGRKAQLDFVPEDPATFEKAAKRLELEVSEPKTVFLIQGVDRAGAAFDHIGKLASEGINVVAAQAIAAGAGRWGMILWVDPDDLDRASKEMGI